MNDQAPPKAWKVTLLTILVLVVLAVGAIPVFSQRIQQDLTQKTQDMLLEKNIDWASVEVDGRDALIRGIAVDPASAQTLTDQIQGIDGIRLAAFEQLDIASRQAAEDVDQTISPYHFAATLDQAQLRMVGAVPDQDVSDGFEKLARQIFGDEAVNADWALGQGQPEGWETAVRTSIAQLARLEGGELSISDQKISLRGNSAQTAISDSVQEQLGLLGEDGYQLEFQVESADAALLTCQSDFTKLLKGKAIHFGTGRVQIRPDSHELLTNVFDIAKRCDEFSLEVAGHTDSLGGAARNKQLSQQRAQAVVNWLADKGLDISRMKAVGHGERFPVADNNTRSGRALNRRIEITVRGQ